MKKLSLFAASAVAFLLIAAPIYVKYESRAFQSGGKTFFNAQKVNGQWAVPVQDFAKAFGGTLTLEQAGFQLQGSRLVALMSNSATEDKHKVNQGSLVPAVSQATGSSFVPAVQQKTTPGAIILQSGAPMVRKAGVVSNRVFMADGQAWIPATDVAGAFGGTLSVQGNNTLSFAAGANGVLGFHP